jgi:Fur family peroxide stress response transcriptional regulator
MNINEYKKLGFKLTAQRLAIIKFLEGNTTHPSAYEIYKAVKRKFPTMSFATVYYTLNKLKDQHLITELTTDATKKRFDPNTSPHHHIICLKCKKIKDIFNDFVINLEQVQKEGYQIISNHIEFFGFCPKCRKKIKGGRKK